MEEEVSVEDIVHHHVALSEEVHQGVVVLAHHQDIAEGLRLHRRHHL